MKPERSSARTSQRRRARWLPGVLVLLCAACGTSDADRIDDFVKAVTGEVSSARIDQALTSYVDLNLQPLDVSVFGDPRGYGAEQRAKLGHDAHARLGSLFGNRLNVLRKRVEIRLPNAYVDLQLLGRGGMGNVRYTLVKHGERWLIAKVDVGG